MRNGGRLSVKAELTGRYSIRLTEKYFFIVRYDHRKSAVNFNQQYPGIRYRFYKRYQYGGRYPVVAGFPAIQQTETANQIGQNGNLIKKDIDGIKPLEFILFQVIDPAIHNGHHGPYDTSENRLLIAATGIRVSGYQ